MEFHQIIHLQNAGKHSLKHARHRRIVCELFAHQFRTRFAQASGITIWDSKFTDRVNISVNYHDPEDNRCWSEHRQSIKISFLQACFEELISTLGLHASIYQFFWFIERNRIH